MCHYFSTIAFGLFSGDQLRNKSDRSKWYIPKFRNVEAFSNEFWIVQVDGKLCTYIVWAVRKNAMSSWDGKRLTRLQIVSIGILYVLTVRLTLPCVGTLDFRCSHQSR